jgi:heptaprenylglyceryl phosphate synthase
MGLGCLVKILTPSSGAELVMTAYVVSEQDASRAINIIRRKIASRTEDVVFVSRVSEELLNALGVEPGEFTRADGYPS